MRWSVIAEFVGIIGQPTIMRLMTRLRPARTRIFTLLVTAQVGWSRREVGG
jgi:hypothetical protein